MARRRGPPRLVNDDRFWQAPSINQPIEILMVMKRIATRPIDKLDIRIVEFLAVEIVGLARMQQHVGETRHRDIAIDRGTTGTQIGNWHSATRITHRRGRAVTKAKSPTGQTDLPKHRCQYDRHP